MSDPVTFDSVSPRLGLPLLFAGQAQKEAFVNEALCLLDGLTHCAVVSQTDTPPSNPIDGQTWLIGSAATGDWSGRAGQIALRQGGQWLYAQPRDGMRILNSATGQDLRRSGGAWKAPSAPIAITGGTVVDTEARNALASLVAALRESGVFPE